MARRLATYEMSTVKINREHEEENEMKISILGKHLPIHRCDDI